MARTKKTSRADQLKVGDHVASNVPAFSWRGVVTEPEGGYSVFVPELPSVAAQGETIGDARANVQEAIEGYLKALHDDGVPVPKVQRDRVVARTEW
jgi:predicted RNase H-like HicB family nuclease